MEINIETKPILNTSIPNKSKEYPIGKSHAYLYIHNYPYIIVAPKGLLFIIGIILITILISGLSMIVFTWSWIGWSLLTTQLLSYIVTSFLNPGSPKIAQSARYCNMCGLPNDKAMHCFKCGLCFESMNIIRA